MTPSLPNGEHGEAEELSRHVVGRAPEPETEDLPIRLAGYHQHEPGNKGGGTLIIRAPIEPLQEHARVRAVVFDHGASALGQANLADRGVERDGVHQGPDVIAR